MSGPFYHTYHSAIFEAPIEQVWADCKDVARLIPKVVPGITKSSYINDTSVDTIPAHISCEMEGGKVLEEVVTARDDEKYTLAIRVVKAPPEFGFIDFTEKLSFKPITSGAGGRRTFFEVTRKMVLAEGVQPTALEAMFAGEIITMAAFFAGGGEKPKA